MEYFMGIDPGKTGALALIDEKGTAVLVRDWCDGPLLAKELRAIDITYAPKLTIIEKVAAMTRKVTAFGKGGKREVKIIKQGVTSSFTFGANYGWWLGALDSLGFKYQTIAPVSWMARMKIPKKANSNDKPSLPIARRLFPNMELHLKKHDGRADALMIAEYARCRTLGIKIGV